MSFFRVPFTGVISANKVCGTMTNPRRVGLEVKEISPLNSEFKSYRVSETIEKDIHDEHNSKYMTNPRPFYKKGGYDFVITQEEPANWSGYFDD